MKKIKLKNQTVLMEDFSIKKLTDQHLPYTDKDPVAIESFEPTDENGVILFTYKGKKYFHPVLACEAAFTLLNLYRRTGKKAYLERTEKFAERLVKDSITNGQVRLLPYYFSFYLHNSVKEEDMMTAPWFCAMAQGEALSFLVRLFKITKNESYLNYADQIFNGLLQLKGQSQQWVSLVDENGFLWLEEYPLEQPSHALNGFIFAIIGLYEYFLVRKSQLSERVLKACLTTVKRNIDQFRRPGDISFYCLGHRVQSEKYHQVHINQLEILYQITGDIFFQEKAHQFLKDGKNLLRKVRKCFLILKNLLARS